MRKRNKWLIFFVILAVVGGIVTAIILRPEKKPEYSTAKVYRGNLKQTVSVTGRVEPKKVVDLAFEKNEIVDKIKVEVGDEVRAGDLLVELRKDTLALEIEQAEVNLNLAKANLKMAETCDLEAVETAFAKAREAYLNTKVENARLSAEDYLAWEEAKNHTRDYQEYFNEIEKEYEDDNIDKYTRDLVRANLTQIQGTEQKTQKAWETLAVTNKKTEDAAWYVQEAARQDLEKQKALAYDWEKSNLLNQADANRVARDLAQNNLSKNNLKSPLPGVVSKINIEEGETASALSPVITIISRELVIRADVPEADIAKIKKGQEAEITFDALESRSLPGKVIKIDPTETKIEGVTYYKIELSFDDPEHLVKPGMSCDLTIAIESRENVLIAPGRALKSREGKFYVQVKEGEVIREQEVKIGLRGDEGKIEIVEGLKEEDEVVTFIKEKK